MTLFLVAYFILNITIAFKFLIDSPGLKQSVAFICAYLIALVGIPVLIAIFIKVSFDRLYNRKPL